MYVPDLVVAIHAVNRKMLGLIEDWAELGQFETCSALEFEGMRLVVVVVVSVC